MIRNGDVYTTKKRGRGESPMMFVWSIEGNIVTLRHYGSKNYVPVTVTVTTSELAKKWRLVEKNTAGTTYESLLSKETLAALKKVRL